MEVPPEITFRGLEKSAEIETHFHKNAVVHDDFERLEIGTGV